METNLLEQGLELMLAGMGTVFVFLTLLVIATSFMSWITLRYLPATEDPTISDAELAAVGAAVARYRGDTQSKQ